MQLHLHAHRQGVLEYPARQHSGLELPVDGGEEDRAALGEGPLADQVARPLVVLAPAQNELHLVLLPESAQVLPVHPVGFAGAGGLDVHYRHRSGVQPFDRDVARGLDDDLPAVVEEPPDEGKRGGLGEGLSPGQAEEP